MTMDLFSVFDPATGPFCTSLNWFSIFLGVFFMPLFFWALPSRFFYLFWSLMYNLHLEFKNLLSSQAWSYTLISIPLFLLVLFNNSLGLIPYIFTSTSHMTVTFSFALPLWFSFMLYGWIQHTQSMLAHLVPQGTPSGLMVFMVLIETISNVIRPLTLAIRLSANMIAGHLLLALLGGVCASLSFSTLTIVVLSQNLLMLLEVAVSLIQSYVFVVLITLYISEVS